MTTDRSRSPGLFLAIEGPEGAGKSTQVRLLASSLRERGIEPVVTREPGGTPVAEAVRRVLLESESVPAEAELLLMLAARAALVREVIEPALATGRVVITDRFYLSTQAYQVHGRGLPADEVEAMNRFATSGLEPDLTLLLEVTPEQGATRRAAVGSRPDRIERAGAGFHTRVAGAYALLAAGAARIERVDGTRSPASVHGAILAVLARRFPETFAVGGG